MKQQYMKIILFSIMIALFAGISYSVRDYLIANYNNISFPFFTVDYVKNSGAAFSLFQTHTNALIVISSVILLIFAGIIFANVKRIRYPELILYAFMLAGVFCNLYERITDGFVTDYIRLSFITFPIFNLSDVFINVGAFLIICKILFDESNAKKSDRAIENK